MIKYKDPVTGRWVNLPYIPGNSGLPVVMPEMFGAKGDGKTDDSAAIQNAILNCGDFGTLYFSNKPYRITRSISVDRKINIEGRGCSINVDCEDVIPAALHFTNQSDMTRTVIRDVFVRCRKKAINGFLIGDGNAEATQITIDNCKVTQALEDGFKVVPMAYCIRFQDCYAESNGHSGISAVATDFEHQMNAVSIEGCTLIVNGRHGAHINGINIVVENCIIEVNGIWQNGDVYYCVDENNPGSGIFVGYLPNPSCSSVNIVVQNNYFEPSYEAQITTCVDSVSLRVLNNYFLIGGSRRPAEHMVTNVKCNKPESVDGAVYLVYENNASAGAKEEQTYTEVDGGGILAYTGRVFAKYAINTSLANLTYPPDLGTRYYIPISLSSGTPVDRTPLDTPGANYGTLGNRSVNLVTDSAQRISVILPFALYNSVLRNIGFNIVTDGTTATLNNDIYIRDEHGNILKQTRYTHTLDESKQYTGNLLNNFGYYNIPNGTFVEVIFRLSDKGNATSVVIENPFIDIYNP